MIITAVFLKRMKRTRIIHFFLVILFSACAFKTASAQQAEVQRVRITSSRAHLYFSQEPTAFTTSLSPDKKKITILLKNTSVAESAKNTHGTGAIEDIYIQQKNKDLEVNILLKDKRGYTAAALPFSKSIAIEVFDWNTVKGVEDDYRSGLLALETSRATAQKFFLKAAAAGHADAAAHAGIIFLKEGNTAEAQSFLLKATNGNTTIADAYAALAQIHAANGEAGESAKMLAIFSQRTGTAQVQGSSQEPSSLAADAFIDSLSVSTDSAAAQTFASDSAATAQSDPEPIIFKNETKPTSWTTKFLLSALVIAGGIIGIVGWLYLRWRKQFKHPAPQTNVAQNPADLLKDLQNLPQKTPTGENFAGVFSHAAKAYQQADSDVGNSFKSDGPEVKPFKNDEDSKPVESDKDFFLRDQQEMKQSWLELLNEKPEAVPHEEQEVFKTQADETAEYSSPGNVEFAKNIQREQQKQKSAAFKNVDPSEIDKDPVKIQQQAKKLGLEQASLETKKKLAELETDEERLAELRKKFSHE
jgi:hypothetical protein